MQKILKALLSRPEISALVMLIIVVVGFRLNAEEFLSTTNLTGIFSIVPELGLVAIGVTILMISGEFDLSVGSVFALVPMLTIVLCGFAGAADAGGEVPFLFGLIDLPHWLAYTLGNPWVAIVVALLVALGIGAINGWVTLSFGIPSFVTTLGMLFVARSLTVVLSGGFPPSFPDTLPTWLFVEPLWMEPSPRNAEVLVPGMFRASFIWFAALAVALGIYLHRTNFGNWIYATGGQRQAAQDMGINVRRVKMTCFMMCSLLAGLAGIIQTFRLGSAVPSVGEGLELQAIAAAVIGGAALTGGIGSIIGAVVGAFLIRMIDNGLVMSRIDANWFKLAIGVLTVLAVILNIYIRQRAYKMKS